MYIENIKQYLKFYYLVFFISTKKEELITLQALLNKYKFKVSNIYKDDGKYIFGVNLKKKTILELLYLTILAGYLCNIKKLENITIKVNSILTYTLAKSLQTIFNNLITYKTTYYKNNLKIEKNILKTKFEDKDKIIKREVKLILLKQYKDFLYFLKKLQQKSNNVLLKQILNNFLNKFKKQKQKQKEEINEAEKLKEIFDI